MGAGTTERPPARSGHTDTAAQGHDCGIEAEERKAGTKQGAEAPGDFPTPRRRVFVYRVIDAGNEDPVLVCPDVCDTGVQPAPSAEPPRSD